ITSTDWPATALLPKALATGGMEAFALCPTDHIITYSRYLTESHAYAPPIDAVTFNRALASLVERWQPDVIIAGDDPALWLLHRLRLSSEVATHAPALAPLLERSLGRPDRLLELERKSRLADTARALGIATAPECVNPSVDEALAFAETHGWPVVVKHDYTWAGTGVRFAHAPDELRVLLGWRPDIATIAPRAVILSRFIGGTTYEMSYAAWQGRLLGCLSLEKVEITRGGGSAVVRRADDSLVNAVEKLVAHFGLSGVGDIEFRVDPSTGEPCLLEINPRVVPTTRLGPLFGLDLCALLRDAVRGTLTSPPAVAAHPMGRAGTPLQVALFPTEWMRDAQSPHLVNDHHDAPWSEPRLMAEMMRRFAPAEQHRPAADAALFSTITSAARSVPS
ncbi:MAG: hypothetical protein EB084_24965, partial [Proteobacteria bacterium]|nr:hypothetical protein [Pseudomonadota bacterium]